MTLLEAARQGRKTEQIKMAADYEGLDAETIREGLAAGTMVIPANSRREFRTLAIGRGLRTKVNANLGTSPGYCDPGKEIVKLKAAVDAGADAVMDLSIAGDLDLILEEIISRSPLMVGSVPIYKTVARLVGRGRPIAELTADDLFADIEHQARAGVDFITVHCGVTRSSVETLESANRLMGVVSRGGSILVDWILSNGAENPLYENFDRLIEIAHSYDITLSLGDGLRPGAIDDAHDQAQISELITLAKLASKARAAGVQVMIEGPGHLPLGRIAADIKLQKRVCGQAPYYVLGPLPTDTAAGHDHIAGAIGGALAAASGADFLCYVTPAEHLCLPDEHDVRQGVLAARIAAHIGDLEKGVKAARDQDRQMSMARRKLDWDAMAAAAIDRNMVDRRRGGNRDKSNGTCGMCGAFCALKTYQQAMEKQRTAGKESIC